MKNKNSNSLNTCFFVGEKEIPQHVPPRANKKRKPNFHVGKMLTEAGFDDQLETQPVLEETQKKLEKVNRALEFSNDHLHSIIEGTSDLIAALDLDFKIISFNNAYKKGFEDLVGVELRQGMCLPDMLKEFADIQKWTTKYWSQALKGESFTSTYALEITGHINYLEASFTPIKNVNNQVVGATSVIRNVTRKVKLQEELHRAHELLEAKVNERTAELEKANKQLRREIEERAQAERLLLDSEQKFKAVFENASAGMCLSDTDGNMLLVNSALCKMIGLSKQDCSALKLKDFLYQHHSDKNQIIEQKLKSGEIATYQTTQKLIHNDGSSVWAEVSTVFLKAEGGQKDYFISHIQNVTDQLQIERRLTRERNLAEGIINSLPGIFYIFDKDGKLKKWNKNLEKITGYSAHEIPEKSILRLFDVDEVSVIKESIREIFHGSESEVEANLVSKDGTKTPYYFTGTVTHYEGGHYLMGMGIDITDRVQAEDTLKLHAQELKKLNASKDKLFSIVAHDLRSPFTGLIGLSDILNREIDMLTDEEVKNYAGNISKSANNVFHLLNNLLEWSKVQLNGTELNPINLNLRELAVQSIEPLRENLKAKNIDLDIKVDKNIQVTADRNMLGSVIQNLVSNSLKFTKNSGSISLKAEERDDHIITQVSDTGIGMSDEVLKSLFSIEKNKSRKGTHNEKGSGLGLILCKEFIENHRGEIWVESTEAKGSTFFFTLPKK